MQSRCASADLAFRFHNISHNDNKSHSGISRHFRRGRVGRDDRRIGVHSATRGPGAGSRAVLRRVVHRRHRRGGRVQRRAQRRARSAQRGVGRAASQPLGHPDSRLEIHRGHRHGELSLHLASAEGPHMGLRRSAENGPLRGSLAGPVEHHRLASAPRRASDVRAAGRPASTGGAYLTTTARAGIDALHPFDDPLNAPQRLAEQASSSGKPMDLITLRTDDNNNIAPAIGNLPGVVITPQAELLPTDYHFASALMGQVKKAVIDQLDGQAGWRVVSVNQNDVDVAVLHEVEPSPAASVSISLDRTVQNAAQHAVDNQGRQAMIVVIKPSTGEILAVAQNAAADALGPVATTGLYPPGSTFKMVTAGAVLERDMASPNTLLGCPGKVDIGHRTIPNYGR